MILEIPYRVEMPTTAKTWFAKMRDEDRETLLRTYRNWLEAFCEYSADPEAPQWQVANFGDTELGRSSISVKRPNNTMLSALSGLVSKLRRGDWTEKQLAHAEYINEIMTEIRERKINFIAEIPTFRFVRQDKIKGAGNTILDSLFDGV